MQESELRDQFEEWAGPLREASAPGVAALRSRIRRRIARIAAAAGSGLAVVGLVAGLLAAGALTGNKPAGPGPQARQTRPGPWGSAKYPAPPGQPYVFVNSSATFVNVADTSTTPAELRNAATGKVVKVLRPVGKGVSFSAVAAAPGDRAFVLAQLDDDETVSFAEIRIGPSGKAGALRPVLPGLSMPAGTQPEGMTVNAPVTRLSFEAVPADGIGGSLVVYNLQAGTLIGSWSIGGGNNFANAQFVGDGNTLVASFSSVRQGRSRLIDASTTFRPGSSLLADSRPDRADGFPGSLTQDGTMSINAGAATLANGQSSGDVYLTMNSEPSGKLVLRVPIGQASATYGQYFCGVLWASADGSEVLTQCGTEQLAIVGDRVSRVKLAWVLPSNPGPGDSQLAW